MGRYLELAKRAVEGHRVLPTGQEARRAVSHPTSTSHRQGPSEGPMRNAGMAAPLSPAVDTSTGCDKSDKSDQSRAGTDDSSEGCHGRRTSSQHAAVPEPGPGADAKLWRAWYEERATIRESRAGYPRPVAERLAFKECFTRWHRLHGVCPDPARCAGCGELVSGREVLRLPDGARVHLNAGFSCLTAYGRRWRTVAVKALASLGLTPPEGWEL